MERGWRLLGSYNSPYTDYSGSGFRRPCKALFKEPGKVSCTFHHSVHHTRRAARSPCKIFLINTVVVLNIMSPSPFIVMKVSYLNPRMTLHDIVAYCLLCIRSVCMMCHVFYVCSQNLERSLMPSVCCRRKCQY